MSNDYDGQIINSRHACELMRRINALESSNAHSYTYFDGNRLAIGPDGAAYVIRAYEDGAICRVGQGDGFYTDIVKQMYFSGAVCNDATGIYLRREVDFAKIKYDGRVDTSLGYNGSIPIPGEDQEGILFLYEDGCLGFLSDGEFYKFSTDAKTFSVANEGSPVDLFRYISSDNCANLNKLGKYDADFSYGTIVYNPYPKNGIKVYAFGGHKNSLEAGGVHIVRNIGSTIYLQYRPDILEIDKSKRLFLLTNQDNTIRVYDSYSSYGTYKYYGTPSSSFVFGANATDMRLGGDGLLYVLCRKKVESRNINLLKVFSTDGSLQYEKYVRTRTAISQTAFYGYRSGVSQSLGVPDGGSAVPGDNALCDAFGGLGSDCDAAIIQDMRRAIGALLGTSPYSGRLPYLRSSGVYYTLATLLLDAMGDRTKYGASGGAKSTWTKEAKKMTGTEMHGIDIGEIYECVRVLEGATKVEV